MVRARSEPVRTVGRCIYCLTSNAPLSEEHVLAANLGGSITLLEACCPTCQGIINDEFEQPFLRKMVRDVRYRNGIGSRRLNKRPKRLSTLRALDGAADAEVTFDRSKWISVDVPYEEHLTFFVLPIMRPPGLLRGLTPEATAAERMLGLWAHTQKPKSGIKQSERLASELSFNDAVFARLLAKTAHGAAVAALGLDGFDPFLIDLILGRDSSKRWYFAGCDPEPRSATLASSISQIRVNRFRNGPYCGMIMIRITIFANLGAPTYCVVAGKQR